MNKKLRVYILLCRHHIDITQQKTGKFYGNPGKIALKPCFCSVYGRLVKGLSRLPANLTCPDGAMGKPPKRDFDDLSGGGAVLPGFSG